MQPMLQPMRPRFQLTVPYPPEQVFERFQRRLACQGCPCQLTILGQHLEVGIHERLSHFWSPRLSVEVTPGPEGTSELHGLFGPNPNVWTMFLAGYAFLLLSAVFSGIFGLCQLMVATGSPWGLWLAAGCVVALVLPYTGSLIGQRLAAEQMEMLRCFLRASLELPQEGEHPAPCVVQGLPPTDAVGTRLPVV